MRRYEAKDRNSIAEPVHVLHVTESLGAGVESAIRAYVEATPEIRCPQGNNEADPDRVLRHCVSRTVAQRGWLPQRMR